MSSFCISFFYALNSSCIAFYYLSSSSIFFSSFCMSSYFSFSYSSSISFSYSFCTSLFIHSLSHLYVCLFLLLLELLHLQLILLFLELLLLLLLAILLSSFCLSLLPQLWRKALRISCAAALPVTIARRMRSVRCVTLAYKRMRISQQISKRYAMHSAWRSITQQCVRHVNQLWCSRQ